MRQRVSELITTEEIKKWGNGDVITITAGTGVGKSYFIKNILYAFAKKENKKILFLIHRTNCTDQFQKEIENDRKDDIIDIKTYQYIEARKMYKNEFDLSDYKYIVSDEFHYFMSDSAFSKTTDISLNCILDMNSCVRIFMSATGKYTKNYINNIKNIPTIDYELPIVFDFIESLTFYNLDDTLEMFINESIKSNEKAIFFIQSAKKAYELYNKYKDYCLFNCSRNNKDYYKYVDEIKIENMLTNEKFDSNILITTTCMDAGVNIIDEDVKHIICDVGYDISILIQCIGRKRLQNNKDKIFLYVKSITNNYLGGKETQLRNKIKMADYLRDHTVKEYIEEFPRSFDYNQIVYDDVVVNNKNNCTKKINELMYFKCKKDICDIQLMKMYGKYGFNKFVANKLDFIDKEGNFMYRLIEEEKIQNELEKYLDSITDKRLTKEEQKELVDKIGLKDARGRLQKSISTINAYIEENKLPYIILSKVIKENNKSKRVWVVNKLILDK